MRQPINPVPGMRPFRVTSAAISFNVDVYYGQPGWGSAVKAGTLSVIDASMTDDASRSVQRTMTINLRMLPDWLLPGMWVAPSVGVQIIQPVIYNLPRMIITDIVTTPSDNARAVITVSDPAEVLNGRPYEMDTALSGTLRALVGNACSTALQRTTDVSAVPNLLVPLDTIAEFGTGRWDMCVRVADSLNVALRFTDTGDVVGILRTDPVPAPLCIVEVVGGAGQMVASRTPTAARVYMDRSDQVGVVGKAPISAVTGQSAPWWYSDFYVTDQQQRDGGAGQSDADALALALIRQRLADLDTFDGVEVLPTPWLEAGADCVEYRSKTYRVRAINMEFPSLKTRLTLRRAL